MADDNKAPSDRKAEQPGGPAIKPEEVKVTVKPRQEDMPSKRDQPARRAAEERVTRNKQLADKATEGATKEVREAVEKAAPAGREAQKQAAEQAAEQIGQKLPQQGIKEVQVDIPGEKPITKPATEGPPPPQKSEKKLTLTRRW